MLDPSPSAALSHTPAVLAERYWKPPNQWLLPWRQRPDPPIHYTSQHVALVRQLVCLQLVAIALWQGLGFSLGLCPSTAWPLRVVLSPLVMMVHGHPFLLLTLLSYCPNPSLLPLPL